MPWPSTSSIGRGEDFDLTKLKLHSSHARRGMSLFPDTGSFAKPGHKTAMPATSTRVAPRRLPATRRPPAAPLCWSASRADSTAPSRPTSTSFRLPECCPFRHGGFGRRTPLPALSFGNLFQFPGAPPFPGEAFNSMSVVESADTAPFFHNHAVATLEEAIAFYGTDAYKGLNSIGEEGIGPVPVRISSDPDDPEVLAISTFLRVLNVLENVRSAISVVERARRAPAAATAWELAGLAQEEVRDALQVFSRGSMQTNSEFVNALCRGRLTGAASALGTAPAAAETHNIEPLLAEALLRLRGARALLVDESTLPASFRQ